jgi:transposase
MRSFSLDLRKRVLAACEAGWLTQPEVAEEFGVSVAFITKLLRREREEGTVAARPRGGNRPAALRPQDLITLRHLVKEQPDATLAELRDRLEERRGVNVGLMTVCRALRRLRLPLKKSRCTRRSGTRRGCGECGAPTAGRSARCRGGTGCTWTRRGPRWR